MYGEQVNLGIARMSAGLIGVFDRFARQALRLTAPEFLSEIPPRSTAERIGELSVAAAMAEQAAAQQNNLAQLLGPFAAHLLDA